MGSLASVNDEGRATDVTQRAGQVEKSASESGMVCCSPVTRNGVSSLARRRSAVTRDTEFECAA